MPRNVMFDSCDEGLFDLSRYFLFAGMFQVSHKK